MRTMYNVLTGTILCLSADWYYTMSQCWLLLYILCLSADWYYGEKHGVMGLLPANYIKLLVDMEEGDDKVS